MQKDIDKFLEYVLVIQGNSQSTAKNYENYLGRFLSLTGISDIKDITLKIVNDFIISMKKEQYNNRTINYHLTALKCWLKYESKVNGHTVINVHDFTHLKFEKPKIEIASKEIMRNIGRTNLNALESAVLNSFLSTGLRLAELLSLNIEDIDFENNRITVRGKGSKLRLVFMAESMNKSIREFIGDRKAGQVFPYHREKIYRIVRDIGRAVGISLYPHKLRHIFATNLLENGAPMQAVSKMLGHSSVTTTEMYSHVSNESLQEAFNKYHHK